MHLVAIITSEENGNCAAKINHQMSEEEIRAIIENTLRVIAITTAKCEREETFFSRFLCIEKLQDGKNSTKRNMESSCINIKIYLPHFTRFHRRRNEKRKRFCLRYSAFSACKQAIFGRKIFYAFVVNIKFKRKRRAGE